MPLARMKHQEVLPLWQYYTDDEEPRTPMSYVDWSRAKRMVTALHNPDWQQSRELIVRMNGLWPQGIRIKERLKLKFIERARAI